MATIADDHITRQLEMASKRTDFDNYWQQVHEVAAPDATDFRAGWMGQDHNYMQEATAARASKNLYDTTAVWCVDRLASGIESLIIPQSEYWHGYGLTDFTKEDETDEEKLFLERLRNLTFKLRYDADTGWTTAMQTAIRRAVAFGNAFVMLEEGWDRRAMFRYRYMPLSQCYIEENQHYQVDTFHWVYQLTARQAVQKFGPRVSAKVQRAAEDPKSKGLKFKFLQCIGPRADYGLPSMGVLNSPHYSIHIEYDERKIVGESGFFEFPVVDFRWMPEPGRVYGEGPIMKCLADIQSLNKMAKNELIAGEQAHNPTLLVADAGVVTRPNNAPGAIIYGGMDAQGRRRVEPMMQGQRLDFATMVLEAKRKQVKESMYINLFALLVQNPQMSATEAMIRANEKGELLGPAGSRLQGGLSNLNERELGIMTRRGIFRTEQFRPPQSMADANVGAAFTSPLDRARQGKEVEGTMNLLNVISPIAQIDPSIVDNLDGDEMVRGLSHRMGMPVKFVRDPKKVAAVRSQRQEQQEMAQNAAVAKDMAAASKSGVEAMAGMSQMGSV